MFKINEGLSTRDGIFVFAAKKGEEYIPYIKWSILEGILKGLDLYTPPVSEEKGKALGELKEYLRQRSVSGKN